MGFYSVAKKEYLWKGSIWNCQYLQASSREIPENILKKSKTKIQSFIKYNVSMGKKRKLISDLEKSAVIIK